MNLVLQLSLLVICAFIVWRIYKVIQQNPELMSRANLSKSFTTVGVLALILLGGIAILVLLLRST